MEPAQLGALQDLMLERVLEGAPLPGKERALSFPDLAYVTRSGEPLVLADGYLGDSTKVRKVTNEELLQISESGETGFVEFQSPTESEEGTTLRMRVLLGLPDVEPLPLGELVATFALHGEAWTTVDPTHAVAF